MAYTTVTLADLAALLRTRVDGSVFWEHEEARLALNEALREWNLWTGRWRRGVTIASVLGQHRYTLPSTLTYSMAVRFSGDALHPTSYWDLDVAQPQWPQQTAGAAGVPTTPILWAPQSLTQIVLWPAPDASLLGAIAVSGVSATPVLVEDGDTIDLGDELLDLITDFALHVLAFKEGGPRWRATLPAWKALLQAAAEENGRLKANQAFRRAAGLDYRRQQQLGQRRPNALDQLEAGQ